MPSKARVKVTKVRTTKTAKVAQKGVRHSQQIDTNERA